MGYNRKGNILLLTFILLTALGIIVGSLTYVVTVAIRKTGADVEYLKCLYYAEAGMNKALWNLKTPPYLGGSGNSWRTPGLTEDFGEGTYKIIVESGAVPTQV